MSELNSISNNAHVMIHSIQHLISAFRFLEGKEEPNKTVMNDIERRLKDTLHASVRVVLGQVNIYIFETYILYDLVHGRLCSLYITFYKQFTI